MIIDITQDDLDQGIPGDPCRCPIVKALRRLGCSYAFVGRGLITFINKDGEQYCQTSGAAQRFIRQFDQGRTTKPRKSLFIGVVWPSDTRTR